jgi:hypothetical protein
MAMNVSLLETSRSVDRRYALDAGVAVAAQAMFACDKQMHRRVEMTIDGASLSARVRHRYRANIRSSTERPHVATLRSPQFRVEIDVRFGVKKLTWGE